MAVDPQTYLKAKAFTLWIKQTIGEEPDIVRKVAQLPDGSQHEYLNVEFTESQRLDMIRWMDGQLGGFLQSDKEPGDLQIDFGGVLVPWSMRYVIPLSLGLLAVGYVGRSLIGRRR